MDRGYVKLYRKSIDSQVFANMGLWQVWCWCLMKATHKEKWVPIKTGRGETEVLLKPGQFIFGRKTAAKKLRMKPSTIHYRIKKLQNMQNLNIQTNTHFSIITILNWDNYNTTKKELNTDINTQLTTNKQPTNTKKNNKNNKNISKRKFTPPNIDDVIIFFIDNGYTKESAEKAFLYYSDGNPPWTDSRGKQVRGWKQKMRGVWFKPENKMVESAKPQKPIQAGDMSIYE